MNLKETIDKLNSIAISQPNVNDYVKSGNIYDLSENRNANFSVFCVTQGTHSYDFKNGYNIFNFVLYYVDRLTSDSSNKIEIQSTAIETLKNIIRTYNITFAVVYISNTFGNCSFCRTIFKYHINN